MKSRYSASRTYASLFAPTKPPKPIDIAPAINSASPPSTTSLALPKADRPAVSAKGTVRPSDNPRMASEMILGLTLSFEASFFDARSSLLCDELVCASISLTCVSCCIGPRVPVSVTNVVASETFLVGICPSFVSGVAGITERRCAARSAGCSNKDARMIGSLVFTRTCCLKIGKRKKEGGILQVQFMLFVFTAVRAYKVARLGLWE